MSTHFFGLTDRTFSYDHSVGRNEFAGTGFRNPVDMALGADDVVYVVNRSYENRPDGVRVTVCTFNEEYISEFGSYGEGDGQFIWPASIALDANENIYIADEWLSRISIFNKDGEFLSKWGKAGSGDGELDRPAGLAISGNTIFISDSRNNRIQKFSLDGKFQGKFGSPGNGPGQFNLPWGIAPIQQSTADRQWQASFGSSGSGVGQFNRPNGVGVDQDGDIYVADWLNNRVQVLAHDGRFITQLHGDHSLSQWGKDKLLSNPDMIRQRHLAMSHSTDFDKHFSHPCAVKVDDQRRIAVLDHTRGSI